MLIVQELTAPWPLGKEFGCISGPLTRTWVLCAASQSLDVELRTKIGQASQAMATLGKPILAKRHLPTAIRLRLFKALVVTKLFFWIGHLENANSETASSPSQLFHLMCAE